MYLLKLFLLLISFLIFNKATCQSYNFDHFKIEDGLSNNAVICSTQDKNGFLWFGTKDGLNRFDGYRFKKYYSDNESNNGLRSNYIISLFVDKNNQLWVGSDRGLYKYNPGPDNFEIIKGTENDEILEIEQDKNGYIWFISNFSLKHLNPKTNLIDHDQSLQDRTVTSIAIDPMKNIWAATTQEIMNVNANIGFQLPSPAVGSLNVETLLFCENGKLWIGTQKHGLYNFDLQSKKYFHALPYLDPNRNLFIRDMQMITPGKLWIASESGLIVMNTSNYLYQEINYEQSNPWSISDNALYTLTLDHQGGIWIGSYFAGINYYHRKHNLFQRSFPQNTTNSISGRAIREIIQEPTGNLWIGTEDNGLNYYDSRTGAYQHYSTKTGLSDNNIHGLALVGDSLLIGTFNNGLDVMDIHSKKVIAQFNSLNTNGKLGNNFIMSIYQTKSGKILLTTARGVFQFIAGKNEFKQIKQIPESIFYTSVLEDDQGCLWLTTWRDGVYYIDSDYKIIKLFKHNSSDSLSLNSNRTNRVFQDSNKNFWIATENGLYVWSKTAGFIKKFTKKNGLKSNLIFSITEDAHQNLWISTSYGLACINSNDYKLSVYNDEFGLSSVQFNYNSLLNDATGNLYFGSTNGLIKFHPDSIKKYKTNPSKVPIYLTYLQTSKREYFFKEINIDRDFTHVDYAPLLLDHDESSFQVEFAALNFVDAATTSYEYKLVGFESGWKLSLGNQVSFAKIPSGDYELKIRALDNQGNIITNEIGIAIMVAKPFWASGYAYVIYGIILLLILYFIYSYFNNRIITKNKMHLAKINSVRESKLYQAKIDFFTQVAHAIKTPLTLIMAPLEKLLNHQDLSHEKSEKLLNTMQKNTDKLVRLTNSILDFQKVEMGENTLHFEEVNISKLVDEFIHDYKSSFKLRNVKVVNSVEDNVHGKIDLDVLTKILDNLFSNALKYADEKVFVRSFFDQQVKQWIFEIKNDGVVLTKQDAELIFKPFHRLGNHANIAGSGLGLALASSFAKLHKGELRYVENNEKLNIFVLAIPISNS